MKYRLPYWIKNCGDGSVSLRPCATLQAARDAEEADQEEYGEGWGEPCAGAVTVVVRDGVPYWCTHNWNGRKWVEVMTPLEKCE